MKICKNQKFKCPYDCDQLTKDVIQNDKNLEQDKALEEQ